MMSKQLDLGHVKAINVEMSTKYELTYIPVDWTCPFCKQRNNTLLIEEEDLNFSQDNFDNCSSCKKQIVLTAQDIFDIKLDENGNEA